MRMKKQLLVVVNAIAHCRHAVRCARSTCSTNLPTKDGNHGGHCKQLHVHVDIQRPRADHMSDSKEVNAPIVTVNIHKVVLKMLPDCSFDF